MKAALPLDPAHPNLSEVFRETGYTVIRSLIPQRSLDDVDGEVRAVVAAQLARLGVARPASRPLIEDLADLHAASIDAYLATVRLAAKLRSVVALFLQPGVADVARRLGVSLPAFQTTPVIHLMSDRLRIPNGYYGVDTHQDWPALQSGLDSITFWIPLFDVSKSTYPLEVLPESHLAGLYPGRPGEHVFDIDPDSYDSGAFVPVEVPRGGAIAMSGFLLHRSGHAGGDTLRLAFSHRYENAAEDSFVARNYPSAQSRQIRRDLITPGFPSREAVAAVYRKRK